MTSPILFNNVCPPYCPEGYNWNVNYGTNSSKLVPYLDKEDADVALLMGEWLGWLGKGCWLCVVAAVLTQPPALPWHSQAPVPTAPINQVT